MISNEFKQLVKAVKAVGKDYEFPFNIFVDKVSGEVKQTPKNLKAFELVKAYDKLSDAEKAALKSNWRVENKLRDELLNYVKGEMGDNTFAFTYRLPDLSRDYNKKVREFQKKKEREEKKASVAAAKAKVAATLNRKDIAEVIKRITSQMEPYIKEGEKRIKDSIVKQAETVRDDYNKDGILWAKKEKGMVTLPKSTHDHVKLKDGQQLQFIGLLRQSPFMDKYFDPKYPSRTFRILRGDVQLYIIGREAELYERAMKIFRIGEEGKVEVLFQRLFKSNPTLVGYEMLRPYNGREFTIGAKNDKGEPIVIQTNTIMAGGYNIQRLHNRWLVDVRNSVTGKAEKFTITDKDTK